MSVLDHLDELRTRLIFTLLFLALGSGVSWFYSLDALKFLQSSYTESSFFQRRKEVKLSPTEEKVKTRLDELDRTWKETRTKEKRGKPRSMELQELDARWEALTKELAFLSREIDDLNKKQRIRLQYLGPTDAFFVRLKLAFVMGLAATCPFWIYQVWAFVAPGLTGKEKRAILPATLFASLLFITGMGFALLAIPMTLRVLTAFGGDVMEAQFTVTRFISFVLVMILAFGVTFELPIVMLVMVKLGVVTPAQLKQNRRHAVLVILVIAAMLTPGGDPMTLALLAGPLFLLYEFSLFLTRYVRPVGETSWES